MRNEEAKLILEQYMPKSSRGNGKSMQTLKLTEAFLLAIRALDEERPKWIPVSERLPEDGQRCLVTTKGMLGDIYCEIASYSNNLYKIDKYDFYDKRNVSGFYNYDIEYGFYEDADVTAWIPLPEPYKAKNKTKKGLDNADQDTLMSAT